MKVSSSILFVLFMSSIAVLAAQPRGPDATRLRSFKQDRGKGAREELGIDKFQRIAKKLNWKGSDDEFADFLEKSDDLFVDIEAEALAYACAGMNVPTTRNGSTVTERSRRHAHTHSFAAPAAAAGSPITLGVTDPDSSIPLTPAAVLSLSSRPGATKKLHLSFAGSNTTGTYWNLYYATPTPVIYTPPYDTDGNPNSFSTGELANMVAIWRGVAEDFSTFDIDVTTSEAGLVAGDGIRVAIGGDSWTWTGMGAIGGIAYMESFNWGTSAGEPYTCFVFPAQLGNGHPRYVWQAASHEIGHTLGLNHDQTTACASGIAAMSYYDGSYNGGSNGWAPIMGVGYYSQLSTWDKNEYPCAYNSAAGGMQDDLDVMKTVGRLTVLPKLAGSSLATASDIPLIPGATSSTGSATGVISQTGIAEFFKFTAPDTGSITVTASVTPPSGTEIRSNLDVLMTVYNAAGVVVASFNPAGPPNAANMGASGTFPDNQPGPSVFYVSITGTGYLTPTTGGYSNYASLGYFSLSVSYAPPPPPRASPSPAPPMPTMFIASGGITVTYTSVNNKNNRCTASITVRRQSDNAVLGGVTVGGAWTPGGAASGVTSGTGVVSFSSNVDKRTYRSCTFTVSSVSSSSYVFNDTASMKPLAATANW